MVAIGRVKAYKKTIKPPPAVQDSVLHPINKQASIMPSEFLSLKLQAERSFKHFVRQAFAVVEPGVPLLENFATDAICDHLQAIAEGKRPLDPTLPPVEEPIRDILISVPPRHLKSILTAILFPAWVWIHWPHKKFLFLSYSYELTKAHSRKCRELIKSEFYQTRWGDRFKIADDSDTLQRFDNDKGGCRYATSLGSQIMGFGADIICLRGDSEVQTDRGLIRIDDIVENRLPVSVLGPSGRYNKILEYKKNPALGRFIYEIETSDGVKIWATEEHPFFCVGRGYIPVSEMLSLLDDNQDLRLLQLPKGLFHNIDPGTHEKKRTVKESVLFSCLSRSMAKGREQSILQWWNGSSFLSNLPKKCGNNSGSVQENQESLLFQQLSIQGIHKTTCDSNLSSVRRELRKEKDEERSEVLHPGVCGQVSSNQYPWGIEWPIRSWEIQFSIFSGVHKVSEICSEDSRRGSLRDLSSPLLTSQANGCSSHRRNEGKARSGKSSNSLWEVSSENSQGSQSGIEFCLDRPVRVASIHCCGQAPEWVYNLNVENDHAYYANGLLNHNCGDDLNNTGEIHSKNAREAVKNLWDDVVTTRLNDMKTGCHIIIAQRVHDDDLNGHVSRKDKNFGHYVKLVIPAEFEAKFRCVTRLPWSDPRKREGDLICPERFGPAEIRELKISLGPFNVAAQLQQRPVPVEGGVFEHDWFKSYLRSELPHPSAWNESCISCDMSFGSIKDTASYVVYQAWCKVGSRFYLIDQVRGQWRYTKAKNELRKFIRKHHNIYAVYVENKALGPAVLEDLEEEGFPGLMPVDPKDGAVNKASDKVSRAHAVSPLVAAGNVYIPDSSQKEYEWVSNEFFAEVDVFPMGANDDQVDTMSQALKLLRGSSAFGVDCDDYNGAGSGDDEEGSVYNGNLPDYQQYGFIGAGSGGFVKGHEDSGGMAGQAVNSGLSGGAARPSQRGNIEYNARKMIEERTIRAMQIEGDDFFD